MSLPKEFIALTGSKILEETKDKRRNAGSSRKNCTVTADEKKVDCKHDNKTMRDTIASTL